MSKLKIFRVEWQPSIELIVAAHDAVEAREMIADPDKFTFTLEYEGRSAFRKGGRVFYTGVWDESIVVSEPEEGEDKLLGEVVTRDE